MSDRRPVAEVEEWIVRGRGLSDVQGIGRHGRSVEMMEAAQQMQTKMTEMQDGLNRLTVVGEAGGGLVRPPPPPRAN